MVYCKKVAQLIVGTGHQEEHAGSLWLKLILLQIGGLSSGKVVLLLRPFN